MIFVVGSIGAAGFGAYTFYQDTQDRIQKLTSDNAKYRIAVENKDARIDFLESQAAENQQRVTNLNKSLRDAETYNDGLRSLLQKHDLTNLAAKKPGLIEKRMNDATNKLFDDISGSSATE
jgi:uncharacterized coiled-coil protein SlyX